VNMLSPTNIAFSDFSYANLSEAGKRHLSHLPASKFRTDNDFAGSTLQILAHLVVLCTADLTRGIAFFQ
jgi:hypothetical protein